MSYLMIYQSIPNQIIYDDVRSDHIKLFYIINQIIYHIIYLIISYIIISYVIISGQIISDHIISDHVITNHIISDHITSDYIISDHIISYHIWSYHIWSYHIWPYHIWSYLVMSYLIISYLVVYIYIYLLKKVQTQVICTTMVSWIIPIVRQSKTDWIHRQVMRPLRHGGSHFVNPYYPWNHGRTYDLSLDFFQQLKQSSTHVRVEHSLR